MAGEEGDSPLINQDSKTNKFFRLDKDQLDKLKKDWVVINPHEDQMMQGETKEIAQAIEELYGGFIPDETRQRGQDIEDRVLMISDDKFEDFHTAQLGQYESSFGSYSREGDFVTIVDPPVYWKLASDESKDKARSAWGNQAAQKYMWLNFTNTLSHELLHYFSKLNLNPYFAHLAIPYYQQQIYKHRKQPFLEFDISKQRRAFYEKLIAEVGDDIHKLFFGIPISPESTNAIQTKLTKEVIERLYPQPKAA